MDSLRHSSIVEDISVANLKTYGKSKDLRYQETLLYGQHSRIPLSKYAQIEAHKEKRRSEKLRKAIESTATESALQRNLKAINRKWKDFSQTDFGRKINDFIFLTSLGIIVAIISFVIDLVIFRCHTARSALLHLLDFSVAAQFFGWIAFFIIFTCFAVGITHAISPLAIGSGIPEVKTMLRGVVMKEYLTFRTLVAKVIGLMAALGSGLPVGKEGSFVHISAVVSAIISKHLPAFSSLHENHESRMAEILMPASAVGVSCTFAAPVGGLLYSLESTSTYFAIKNYWRGFYASAIGTLFFRLFSIWFQEEETLTALKKTYLPQDEPFDPVEIVAFLLLGLLSGVFGVCFILLHKSIVLSIRSQKRISEILQSNRFLYPTIVAFIVGVVQFPPWFGQYTAAQLTNSEALQDLYSNFTWSTNEPDNIDEQRIINNWLSPLQSVISTTALFFLMRLWMCALSTTCPFPCGLIVPAFAIGAGFGRLFGELLSLAFPDGVHGNPIIPGGYALVGSVAFAGAVTHTFSPVVIAFELTGQIGHVMPSLLAVMMANLVSRSFTPSVYDCIIQIKRLPYLPSQLNSDTVKSRTAENIMVSDVRVLTLKSTYGEAMALLKQYPFKSFPIVRSRDDRMLVGSIERELLKQVVNDQLTMDRKFDYFSNKLKQQNQKPSSPTSAPEHNYDVNSNISSNDQQSRKVSSASSRFVVTRIPEEQQHHRMRTPSFTSGNFDMSRKISSISEYSSYFDHNSHQDASHGTEAKNHSHVRFKPSNTTIDLHDPDQEREWENFELIQRMDFKNCRYDAAPFQISKQTTLYKVYHYFSLLSLHHALITDAGRLVGIISLSEVRDAIQVEVDVFGPTVFKAKTLSCSTCCSRSGRDPEGGANTDADDDERDQLASKKGS